MAAIVNKAYQERKTLNNNDYNHFFWVRETEYPQLTIVLTKTTGKQPVIAMPRVTASDRFFRNMATNFRGNGYNKNRIICDCAGAHPCHKNTLVSNSLFLSLNAIKF